MSKRIQYKSLDLFKFFFAIVVVMIHTRVFNDIQEGFNNIFMKSFCNIAVPFFFVTSGFLLSEKTKSMAGEERKNAVKKYVLHILKMYFVWAILWIPWKVLYYISVGHFGLEDLTVYLQEIFIKGNAGDALWYLHALFFSVLILYALRSKIGIGLITVISLLFYLFGVLIMSWGILLRGAPIDLFVKYMNKGDCWLILGMPFVSMGMYISEKRPVYKRSIYIPALIISFVLLVWETVKILNSGLCIGNCMQITLPIVTFTAFMCILNIKFTEEKDFSKLRDYSTLIYLCHCIIIRFEKMIFAAFKINVGSIILFLITFVLSFVFSSVIVYLVKQKNMKILKILY